ncbi:OstA-like protein [Parapedobacter tibetensis]|uniref:OstA-like protein n=1 Tax=Parapedobacter tibetensis TaxID=2972951 RepID=UPI00214D67D8|nr:OstA-like protein [Parapedobacter tibetensis]
MKKCLLLIILAALISSSLYAQQDELRLISSSHSRLNAVTGNVMNYRPVYEHKGSTLSADSGYIYNDDEGKQYFDAFGRVIITQPNGTVIYADKLHYIAETQLATLTNNVRMVDGDAVLTTNYLTYNMKNSVGTYTGGGRIVNSTDTITSKNAYYFDNTKDAYFRYDVIVRTPDVKIYTDTMRYNSVSKMTYFFGPTNIKGNEGENLYTERGEYNTDTEQAWFDKNNLYTEGSRFLRGDSLYYDGTSGNGRAVDNVVFIDTADQFFAFGGVGLYHRVDESITMTKDPLVVTVTRNDREEPDSTAISQDSLNVDTLPNRDSLDADSLIGMPQKEKPAVDSIYMTADTLFSRVIPLKDYIALEFNLNREGGEVEEFDDEDYGPDFDAADDVGFPDGFNDPPLDKDSLQATPDSIPKLPVDSLQRQGIDSLQQQAIDSLTTPSDTLDVVLDSTAATKADSIPTPKSKTDAALLKTHLKRVEAVPLSAGRDILERNLAADSVLRSRAVIPTGLEPDSLMAGAVAAVSRPSTDTVPKDSLTNDTAKTRIIKAYYNVRLFKSDLQAVADSVYYGYPDSLMRFFGRPMIWAQGSQMTSDTIYMQIRNEKLDNMLMVSNAFLVNTQLDSVKYNQIKGRRITGFFTNNELERLFIDGNAESIYYVVDEKRKAYSDMYHSRSSRIKILLDSNQITHFIPIRRVDGKVYPFHLVPQDAEILGGFVWKPGDRPTSKEDILARRRASEGADLLIPADSAAQGQPASDNRPNNDSTRAELPPDSTALDSIAADSLRKNQIPPDSLSVKDTVRMDSLRADSTLKRDPIQQTDSISVIVDDRSPISIGRPHLWKQRTKLGNSSPKNSAILPSEIGYPKSITT